MVRVTMAIVVDIVLSVAIIVVVVVVDAGDVSVSVIGPRMDAILFVDFVLGVVAAAATSAAAEDGCSVARVVSPTVVDKGGSKMGN